MISSGKLDASPITGKWEAFMSQVVDSPVPGVDRAMVIAGSDMRGTIYGLYDVSEQIGVSPWYWMADGTLVDLFSTSGESRRLNRFAASPGSPPDREFYTAALRSADRNFQAAMGHSIDYE